MANELAGLDTLIGGAISRTLGDMGTALVVMLFFAVVASAVRAPFEVVLVFMVGLIIVLSLYGLLPSIMVGAIVLIGTLAIFALISKVLK